MIETSRKSSYAMLFKFIVIWFIACLEVRAEDRRRRYLTQVSDVSHCDFENSRKNYNATDLLQCIESLVVDKSDKESGRSTGGKDAWNDSFYREISLGNIISSLFNENPTPQDQASSFLVDKATSSYYQSNYPAISSGTFDPLAGIGLNLFDALSSISRYDDRKCVPRILCEAASGRLPGRSLGKQLYGFLGNLGQNNFMEWLTKTDVSGSSPLLNFARAMILGYTYRGNSATCYRAFPQCPRDTNQLIHYLNNHNGGFFRLFNRFRNANYRGNSGYQDYSRAREGFNQIISGISKEVDRTATNREKLNFLKDGSTVYESRFSFPYEKEFTESRILNRIPEFLENSASIVNEEQQYSSFFPEETQGAKSKLRFRFPSSATFTKLRLKFPVDSIYETI